MEEEAFVEEEVPAEEEVSITGKGMTNFQKNNSIQKLRFIDSHSFL